MTEHLKQDDFGWFQVVPDKSVPLSRQDRARTLAEQWNGGDDVPILEGDSE